MPPRRGRALVFEHDVLHACPPLANGVKLVVRVDLCYERVDLDGAALKDAFRDSTLVKGKSAFAKVAAGLRKKTSVADKVKARLAAAAEARAARDAYFAARIFRRRVAVFAAAGAWVFHGDESRRRRGGDVDMP